MTTRKLTPVPSSEDQILRYHSRTVCLNLIWPTNSLTRRNRTVVNLKSTVYCLREIRSSKRSAISASGNPIPPHPHLNKPDHHAKCDDPVGK